MLRHFAHEKKMRTCLRLFCRFPCFVATTASDCVCPIRDCLATIGRDFWRRRTASTSPAAEAFVFGSRACFRRSALTSLALMRFSCSRRSLTSLFSARRPPFNVNAFQHFWRTGAVRVPTGSLRVVFLFFGLAFDAFRFNAAEISTYVSIQKRSNISSWRRHAGASSRRQKPNKFYTSVDSSLPSSFRQKNSVPNKGIQ